MSEDVLVSIPRETVNDETVLILSWAVPSGSLVDKDQTICEVETSKAVLEVHAPAAGRIEYHRNPGEEARVGSTLCRITPANAPTEKSSNEPDVKPLAAGPVPDTSLQTGSARLSAAARAAAAEYGVDLASFPAGTLVRRTDILRAAGKTPAKSPQRPARAVPATWVDLPRRKIAEGRILRKGRAFSVQSCVTSECNVTNLIGRLTQLRLHRIGLQAAVIFEAARLLKKYPVFNAMYHRKRMAQYEEVNIGWALDAGQGLVLPVIREANTKSIDEIVDTIQRQMDAYLEGSLSARDLAGATFTVSDLSGEAVSFFQPLVAEGQSAILGISRGPARRGETILYFTLAFDHQLANGKKAAEFLQDLAGRLESHSVALAPEDVAIADGSPYCVICHRDAATLRRLRLALLKSEIPQGFVCSLCAAGW